MRNNCGIERGIVFEAIVLKGNYRQNIQLVNLPAQLAARVGF